MIGSMAKKYKDIYDQLLANSKWNGKCLESTYKVKPKKRPYMTYKNKMICVSRASWQYFNGPIPKGMYVCHKCDNGKCFLLSHLFLGTPSDNMQDMIKKKRDNIFGRRKYSFEILEKCKKLREEGYSYRQISQKTGVKYAAVSASMIRSKVVAGPSKPRPRKFPIELYEVIKKMTNDGYTDKEIYEKLGMCEATFYRMTRVMRGIK